MTAISFRRIAALVVLTVLVIGGAVFSAAKIASNSAEHAARQKNASELMLTAMLNQETGARGYFETRARIFLTPFDQGATAFPRALAKARSLAGHDSVLQPALTQQAQVSAAWHAGAQAQIMRLETSGIPRPSRKP